MVKWDVLNMITRKFLAIFSLLIVLLLIVIITVSGLISNEGNYVNRSTLKIAEGSMYVYEIIPYKLSSNNLCKLVFESNIRKLNPELDVNKINYIITVQKDYEKAVGNRTLYIYGSDFSKSGIIASKDMYIIIKIDSVRSYSITVNVTLSMKDGYARFGTEYYPLPVTDTGWSLENGSYVSYFNSLNMSKLLVIDKSDHDVKDLAGYGLGEWPFWLKSVKGMYTAVLYGLDDMVNIEGFNVTKPLSGEARIIVLNMSSSAPMIFSVNNIHIKSDEQIYNNKKFLGSEMRILNVTSDEKEYAVSFLKKLDDLCKQNSGCKEMKTYAVFPSTLLYNNNTLIIKTSFDMTIFNDKPWIFINDAASLSKVRDLPNIGYHEVIEVMHGVEYKEHIYITNGFPDLESVSYDKNSMVLLYITVVNENNILGMLDAVLPSVIVKAFNIIFKSTKYSELSMRLIDYEMLGQNLIKNNHTNVIFYVPEFYMIDSLYLNKKDLSY
ncbi:MAG: hypothetical protein ACP5OK_03680 [Thermoprotei archaeon]